MDEFDLIERYFARLGAVRDDVLLGVGDDGAVLSSGGRDIAVVTDTLVSGRHFPVDMAAADVGYRAAAVNLSDLAAMGAAPCWATLALTLPAADAAWLDGFAAGLGAALDGAGCALVGGDTTRGPLTVTVQMIGALSRGALTRGGARPGDRVGVTGTLGDAAAGLECLAAPGSAAATYLARRFRRPTPRCELGVRLAGVASAAIDVSDGLLADLGHLARASGVGIEIEAARLPVSAELVQVVGAGRARELALGGGDDYELAVTLPPGAAVPEGIRLIGAVVAAPGVRCLDERGVELVPQCRGYRHFA
ncbi:MAG: thiamine-phosphate kinase [Gammaproteobacteria bacterium]